MDNVAKRKRLEELDKLIADAKQAGDFMTAAKYRDEAKPLREGLEQEDYEATFDPDNSEWQYALTCMIPSSISDFGKEAVEGCRNSLRDALKFKNLTQATELRDAIIDSFQFFVEYDPQQPLTKAILKRHLDLLPIGHDINWGGFDAAELPVMGDENFIIGEIMRLISEENYKYEPPELTDRRDSRCMHCKSPSDGSHFHDYYLIAKDNFNMFSIVKGTYPAPAS